MSLGIETATGELHPDSAFGGILDAAQQDGYPAYLGWSRALAADTLGHVALAPGTRRIVAVVERLGDDNPDDKWLAQTFRVRQDSDNAAAFEIACQEMMEETGAYSVDRPYIETMVRKLYVGYGMKLQYPGVVLECNDPSRADSFGDASISFGSRPSQRLRPEIDQEAFIDIPTILAATFEDDHSEVATLAQDIGVHMNDLAQEIRNGEESTIIYRTRLHNYSWSVDEEGEPRVDDLLLIKANQGSIWYVGAVGFDREVDEENMHLYMGYTHQLIGSEVPATVVEGITSRIKGAKSYTVPNYLMANLLRNDHQDEAEAEDQPSVNAYGLL
jgi:hypothetical protein